MERLVQSIPLRAAENNQRLRLSRNTKRTTGSQSPTVWHSSSCYRCVWRSVTLTLQYDALTCGEINKHSGPAESIHSHGQKLHSTDLKSSFSNPVRRTASVLTRCHNLSQAFPTAPFPRVRIAFIKTDTQTFTLMQNEKSRRSKTSCWKEIPLSNNLTPCRNTSWQKF